MSTNKLIRCKGSRMRILCDMTVYTAGELSSQVAAALGERPALETVDLSEVAEIDTAGLQILLVARRWAAAAGRTLRVSEPSPAVSSMLSLLQLNDWIDAPAAATEGAV